MEIRHFPPVGGFMSGHYAAEGCACKPVKKTTYKNVSSGRGGSHQGRKIDRINYFHNPLPDLRG